MDSRLAPEHPFPAGAEDGYAVLRCAAAAPGELDVDPARIAIGGTSAGGALAAAIALMARDRDGPAMALQYLRYPVLDDRMTSDSVLAYAETPNWTATPTSSCGATTRGTTGRTSAPTPPPPVPPTCPDCLHVTLCMTPCQPWLVDCHRDGGQRTIGLMVAAA